eukprot:4348110-Lingulodinium_polyedra.AAC.1
MSVPPPGMPPVMAETASALRAMMAVALASCRKAFATWERRPISRWLATQRNLRGLGKVQTAAASQETGGSP